MSETLRDHGSSLPRVEESDIFAIDVEAVNDPDLREQWHQLFEGNPELAEEVLMRAFQRATELTEEERNPQAIAQIAVHVTTFALSALGASLRRTDRAPVDFDKVVRDAA